MQVPPPFGAIPPYNVGNFHVGNVPGGYGFGYGQIPQVTQPTPIMMPWAAGYGPLSLPVQLNPIPDHYLKLLPTFNAEKKRTIEDHLADNFYIEHEDVYMRLFVQSLDGDVRKWFRTLPPRYINSRKVLEYNFLQQWGEKKVLENFFFGMLQCTVYHEILFIWDEGVNEVHC